MGNLVNRPFWRKLLCRVYRNSIRPHGITYPDSTSCATEMVAFANSHGGTLLLRVNGDGNVTGVSPNQVRDIEEWVVNIARITVNLPLNPV